MFWEYPAVSYQLHKIAGEVFLAQLGPERWVKSFYISSIFHSFSQKCFTLAAACSRSNLCSCFLFKSEREKHQLCPLFSESTVKLKSELSYFSSVCAQVSLCLKMTTELVKNFILVLWCLFHFWKASGNDNVQILIHSCALLLVFPF